jgi:hypothetical protein
VTSDAAGLRQDVRRQSQLVLAQAWPAKLAFFQVLDDQ